MNKKSLRSILYQTMKNNAGLEMKNQVKKVILPKTKQNDKSRDKTLNNLNTGIIMETQNQIQDIKKNPNSRNKKLERNRKKLKFQNYIKILIYIKKEIPLYAYQPDIKILLLMILIKKIV